MYLPLAMNDRQRTRNGEEVARRLHRRTASSALRRWLDGFGEETRRDTNQLPKQSTHQLGRRI